MYEVILRNLWNIAAHQKGAVVKKITLEVERNVEEKAG